MTETQTIFPLVYKASSSQTKEVILKRDKYTCQICSKKSIGRKLEIHHKIAIRKGGTDNFDNLITVCKRCHRTIEPSRKLGYAVKVSIGRTLKVKSATYTKLIKLAAYGDSMDDIINRLLEKSKQKKEIA